MQGVRTELYRICMSLFMYGIVRYDYLEGGHYMAMQCNAINAIQYPRLPKPFGKATRTFNQRLRHVCNFARDAKSWISCQTCTYICIYCKITVSNTFLS